MNLIYDAITYTHHFFVADVVHNLLGFDFLVKNNLLLIPRSRKLVSVASLCDNLSPNMTSTRAGRKLALELGNNEFLIPDIRLSDQCNALSV